MSMTSLKVKKPDLRVMSGKLEESINNARFDGTEIKLLVSSNKSRIHKVIISWNLLEKEINIYIYIYVYIFRDLEAYSKAP